MPSPMGVPDDPYARPIPLYPGTPGRAIGTPIWPRGTPVPPPPTVLQQPPNDQVNRPLNTLPIPLTIEQCDEGWSKSTHVTPVEFNRRCSLLRRRATQPK